MRAHFSKLNVWHRMLVFFVFATELGLAHASSPPTVAEGAAFFKAGRYAEALAVFEALAVSDLPDADKSTVYYNVGSCLRKLGRSVEAAAAYRKALALSPSSDAEVKIKIKRYLAELEGSAFGAVTVRCNVSDAVIQVGAEKGVCGSKFEGLRPGRHEALGRTSQGVEARGLAEVKAGGAVEVALLFPGALSIQGVVGDVSIDGVPAGSAPLSIGTVEPGRRTIAIRGADGRTRTVAVSVRPGYLTELVAGDFVAPEPAGGIRARPWAWVGLGTGLALAATGGVFLTQGWSQWDEAAGVEATDRPLADLLYDTGETNVTIGWSLAAAGLVGVAGSVVWLILDKDPATSAVSPWVPSASPGGLVWGGTW